MQEIQKANSINRIPVADISPAVFFGGEFVPVKTIPGESLDVSATVFREGHDQLGADVVLFNSAGKEISRAVMHEVWHGGDRYKATITIPDRGEFSYAIESYDHPLATWLHDAEIKIGAGVDSELMCAVGVELLSEVLASDSAAKSLLKSAITTLKDSKISPADRFAAASTSEIRSYFAAHPIRRFAAISEKYPVRADHPRALVGSWYEFFPRSEGAIQNADGSIVSGTFKSAALRIPAVAAMGFDILYLPPIHPIGVAHRKGRNNTLTPTDTDPGVPWAIGGAEGGHMAINPVLGSMKDFEDFVAVAKKNKVEVALDFALQVSPDHPWVKEHPEFFTHRLDGSIAYAENPPKKYQDIYPINFDNDYNGILNESLKTLRFWISKGITVFRVDNPHTKPVHFWADVMRTIHIESPDVIFLAEAFTKAPMMHALGKAGFHQSYTYFTWRTSKQELIEYSNEVAHQTSAFFRPNFWVNTPDINPFHLQTGNPAIFAIRAALASTLTPSWGMYAGFELYEHRRFKEGGEEYLDSEKYEIKVRDWEGATKKQLTLAPFITVLNKIRRENVALQRLRNLRFHHCDNDQILAYSKREGDNLILVVVNLDPNFAQETTINWDMNSLGISSDNFEVTDLIDSAKYQWSPQTYVRLDPTRLSGKVVHIAKVKL
ncbi:MAG: maltotransferase domain-containing protein [Candidatus Planktophila sp.]